MFAWEGGPTSGMSLRAVLREVKDGGRARTVRRGAVAGALLVLIVLGIASGAVSSGAHPRRRAPTGPITVNLEKGAYAAALGAPGLGANTATWDDQLADAKVPVLISQADIGLLRFPGGSAADEYTWQDNEWKGAPQPSSYEAFMSVAEAAKAAPFVTVDYGGGTPTEAAAWVKKAAGMPDQSGALWEIGNEQYGTWEHDGHASPHTPQSYATHAEEFIKAMLAASSKAKIGFPYALTPPQACGSGVEDASSWNSTILSQDHAGIAIADVHWYPFCGTPTLSGEQIVSSVETIPSVMASIRSTLSKYDPSAETVIGETNISNEAIRYSEQPIAALFSAATALEWLSQGAANVTWWDLHGAPDGLLGYGAKKPDAPEPSYDGYELAGRLALPGARIAALSSGSASVFAFGEELGKSRGVLLINDRPSISQKVSVVGFGTTKVTSATYTARSRKLTAGKSTGTQLQKGIVLAPQSVEVLQAE